MSARQEAERRWPEMFAGLPVFYESAGNRETVLGTFISGALWATSPNNPEAVEAVARAEFNHKPDPYDLSRDAWDVAPEADREYFRGFAKAALTALHELVRGEG